MFCIFFIEQFEQILKKKKERVGVLHLAGLIFCLPRDTNDKNVLKKLYNVLNQSFCNS